MKRKTIAIAYFLLAGCGSDGMWVMDPNQPQVARDLAECQAEARQVALNNPAALGLGFARPSPYGINPAAVAVAAAARGAVNDCMASKGYTYQAR